MQLVINTNMQLVENSEHSISQKNRQRRSGRLILKEKSIEQKKSVKRNETVKMSEDNTIDFFSYSNMVSVRFF